MQDFLSATRFCRRGPLVAHSLLALVDEQLDSYSGNTHLRRATLLWRAAKEIKKFSVQL